MRNLTASLVLGSGLLVGGTAQGHSSYGLQNVRSTEMRVSGIVQEGVRVTAGVGGWYMTFAIPSDGSSCSAELKDVSPGVPGALPKWVEWVPSTSTTSTIVLDPARYLSTHTYSMTLRCGLRELQKAFVHLLAPTDPGMREQFTVAHKGDPDSSFEEIAITPKSQL
jgi:hypothetical protein